MWSENVKDWNIFSVAARDADTGKISQESSRQVSFHVNL
jgi:hypothetical protein